VPIFEYRMQFEEEPGFNCGITRSHFHKKRVRINERTVHEIGLCLKSPKSFLEEVSTGSGSDLVNDQHVVFPDDF
jgi:hypothetical protein